MDKPRLERALSRLGQLLRERRVTGEIAVFGGAAIVLGFDFRTATQHVDAMITQGHGQVVKAQEEVGDELRLPPNWLNEQGTSYLSKEKDFEMFKTYPSEGQFGLRVLTATPKYLLAMKLLSFRTDDIQDIVQLGQRLGITTAEDFLQLIKHYYPEEQVTPEKVLQIQSIARQINAPTSLKEAVDRIIGGESGLDAIKEFLDEFYLSGPSERERMIVEEPGLTGAEFQDAYVGAVGEHLARRWGLNIPAWADDPHRFLKTPHFPDYMEFAKPVFLRDSPIAFRRRLIFTEAEPLRRARFPSKEG